MSELHSYFSASGSKKWMACPGSLVLEAGCGHDGTTIHSATGTAAHQLFEAAILGEREPADWLGETIEDRGFVIPVDQHMVDAVTLAVTNARRMTGDCELVRAETTVNYASFLGVPTEKAFGTSDLIAVSFADGTVQVHDYKNGAGVDVDVVENSQAMLYGLGALNEVEDIADISNVTLVVHQPHTDTLPKVWTISATELKQWGLSTARSAAASCLNAERMVADLPEQQWIDTYLRPGSHCSDGFCKARATCPALRKEVLDTVFEGAAASVDEFAQAAPKTPGSTDASEWLGVAMAKSEMIEDWVKEVRAETERRLLAGAPVPGFKLVRGRRGNRAWANPAEAETMLKTFRVKIEDMYDLKLVTPPTAEKLFEAGKIGKRQWPKLQALITQADGKPSVAPESDKRVAIEVRPVAEEFSPVVESDDFI